MKSYFGLAALALLLASCSDPVPTAQQIPFDVWVSPVYSIVETGSTLQLYASASGTNDRAVTWTMLTPGDTIGTLSSNGLYTAPLKLDVDSVVIKVELKHNATGTTDIATISLRPGPLRLLLHPNAGTIYSYAYHQTDTNNAKVPTSETTTQDTIVSVNNNEFGKDSVVHFKDERPVERAYRFEQNLDVLAHSYGPIVNQWLRMPFSNSAPDKIVLLDSTDPSGVRRVHSVETAYLGHEVMIFDLKRYEVLKVRVRTIESSTGANGSIVTSDDMYYFAASLGYFIRRELVHRFDDATEHYQWSEKWLLSKVEFK